MPVNHQQQQNHNFITRSSLLKLDHCIIEKHSGKFNLITKIRNQSLKQMKKGKIPETQFSLNSIVSKLN